MGRGVWVVAVEMGWIVRVAYALIYESGQTKKVSKRNAQKIKNDDFLWEIA